MNHLENRGSETLSRTSHRRWRQRATLGVAAWLAVACLDRSAHNPHGDAEPSRAEAPQAEAPVPAPRADGAQAQALKEAAEFGTVGMLNPGAPSQAPTKSRGDEGGNGWLKGTGMGGGGIGYGIGAGAGFGSGHGRLSGSHASRSMEPEMNTESYAHADDNVFLTAASNPLSTFSVDVDTASYTNVRRFLREGQMPPVDSVRVEEMINYFSYSYAEPTGDAPFSVRTEVAACPWAPEHRLVQIGLRGRSMPEAKVPARNLVFLIDVSGSMTSGDRLPLLLRGMKMLTTTLRAEDQVSIVVYAGASGLVLPPTSGAKQEQILAALDGLHAGGSTNGGEGIQLAYDVAKRGFVKGGINRVILATDGDFNVGVTSDGELTRLVEKKRETGVFLTVLGFGRGNLKDSRMEALADKGNGNYAYIDDVSEARRVLVSEAGATLVTIAKDVKFQVEFNPARVESYRLIGYTNRLLQKEDFNDDKKDAGEIGAGHTVTALYEVVPRGGAPLAGGVDALKYQAQPALAAAAGGTELMTLKLRYQAPTGSASVKLEYSVNDAPTTLTAASTDFRFSAAVAEFAMLLRGGKEMGSASYAAVKALAEAASGADSNGRRREFLSLVDRAKTLSGS